MIKQDELAKTGLEPGERRWLVAIVLVALVVRVALALLPHVLQADEGAYVWLGRNIFTGRGFTFIGIPEVHYAPLFPIVSGLLYLVLHDLEAASKVCFVVFGTGLVWPVYRLAQAAYGRREARVAGLLVAVLPALTSHILYWGSMSEPLYLFLLFWGLWLLWRAWHEGGIGLHAAAAAMLALAYLTRPEGLVYIAAGLVFLLLARWGHWRRGAWGLLAYVAVFALCAAPYVYYLHDETGVWMLSGKVWTAYAQDRALANKDWITFDQMTWGLDSQGEVLYHSQERFTHSLFSYMAAEPRAFVEGTLANARTLPATLFSKEGIPRPLLVFLGLAFFAQAWTRRRAWSELFLGGSFLVPVVTFLPVLYNVRFLQPVYPIAMIWAGRGLVLFGDWLAGTAEAQRGGLREWLKGGLVALPALAIVLYIAAAHPGIVTRGAAYMKFNYKVAGEWLRAHTPADVVVMSRGAIAAIHAEREWSPFPHAPWPEIVRYGQRRHAGYLVVTEQEIRQFQPYLEPLLDEGQPPAELEHLYTYRDAHGRTIVYRFK